MNLLHHSLLAIILTKYASILLHGIHHEIVRHEFPLVEIRITMSHAACVVSSVGSRWICNYQGFSVGCNLRGHSLVVCFQDLLFLRILRCLLQQRFGWLLADDNFLLLRSLLLADLLSLVEVVILRVLLDVVEWLSGTGWRYRQVHVGRWLDSREGLVVSLTWIEYFCLISKTCPWLLLGSSERKLTNNALTLYRWSRYCLSSNPFFSRSFCLGLRWTSQCCSKLLRSSWGSCWSS
jgi:hypothetical protein